VQITVDFSQKTATEGFELIPDGTYSAIVDKVDYCVRNGKDYLNWQFSITDENYLNRKVWMTTYLQTNSVWTAEKAFGALGFKVSEEVGTSEDGTKLKKFNIVVEPIDDPKKPEVKGMLTSPDVESMDCEIVVYIDNKFNPDKPSQKVREIVKQNKQPEVVAEAQESTKRRKIS